FQAEDGIRDDLVTGVQTCALPISGILREDLRASLGRRVRAETFRAALEELVTQKKLDSPGELVKKAGSEIALQPEEAKAKDQIEIGRASCRERGEKQAQEDRVKKE